MWMLIVFVIVCVVIISPFVVIGLLVERANLKQQLKANDFDNHPDADEEYVKGYYQALDDIELVAAMEQPESLGVREAVRRLKETAATASDLTTTQPEQESAVYVQKANSEEAEILSPTEDIWGDTLDGARAGAVATDGRPGSEASPSGMSPQSIINIVLFSGAFLIVGAAAAFVVTSTNPLLKALSIWLAIVAFYGVGVWLRRRKNLQSTGVAFLGIGLALVPFAGVVLSVTLDIPPLASWLIVSCIALVLSLHTTWLVRSEIASYLTIFSLLSLAVAISRNVSEDIFWLLVPIMVVGFGLQLLQIYGARMLHSWALRPVGTMSVLSPTAVLLLALPYFTQLGYGKAEVLLTLATLQFAVQAVWSKRYSYELLARATGTMLFAVIGAHVAATGSVGAAASIGATLAIAIVVHVVLSLLLKQKRDEQSAQIETAALVIYIGAAWAILAGWFFTATASSYMMLSLLLVIAVLSLATAHRLGSGAYRYNLVAALWLAPYAAITLPQLAMGEYIQALAWYYVGVMAVMSLVYVVIARSALRQQRHLVVIALSLHGVSALLHSAAIGDTPLGFCLVVIAVACGLTAWCEGRVKPYIAAHTVALLATWQLVQETFGDAPAWRLSIAAIGVALAGWLVSDVVWRRASAEHKLSLIGSSVGMLVLAWMVSWGYALSNDAWAYLGVVALSVAAGMMGWRAYATRRILFAELAVYTATVAGLYGVAIYDSASAVPFVGYAMMAALIAASLSFNRKLSSRRIIHHGIAQGLLALGVLSTLEWAFMHDLRGYWGAGAIVAMGALCVAQYSVDRKRSWLEWALYAGAFGGIYVCVIADAGASIPIAFYCAVLGTVSAVAGVISDVSERRQSQYGIALGILLGGFAVSLASGLAHEARALWGVYALLAGAGVVLVRGWRHNATKERALYMTMSAVCYGIFIFDTAESVSFIVYAHLFVGAIIGASYFYQQRGREVRLKVALGLVTASVGLKALIEGGGYSMLFLLEQVIILLVGATLRSRWMMLWATVSTSLAVLYFMRDNSWLVLLVIGLMLVGYAIVRSTRGSATVNDKADQPDHLAK